MERMNLIEFSTLLSGRNNLEYIYYPGVNFIFPNYRSKNNKLFLNDLFNHFTQLRRNLRNKVDEDQCLRLLVNVRNLLLEVTDSCNLRCRYCVYSGKFHDRRKHGNKKMSWRTAKSAVDFFFDWILRHKNLRTAPYWLSFGFYGGEPLLNFELIHKSVDYCNNIFQKKINTLGLKNTSIKYSITTNGLLLDNENIDFFITNNFNMIISLDGPKEIQDRNKGKGNFDKLIKKINYLRDNFTDYYKNNVAFSIVYNKDTDLKKIQAFFSQNMFEDSLDLIFGNVTDYFSDIEHIINGLNEEEVIKSIIYKIKNNEPLFKIEKKIISQYFEFNLEHIATKNLFGGYCTLSSKRMYVRVNGDLFGCEKISDSFRIGSIYKGFDVARIIEIEEEWIKNTEICINCILQGCCHACVASIGHKNKLKFDDYCNKKRMAFHNRIQNYIEFIEIREIK